MKRLLLTFAAFVAFAGHSATYYIDYSATDDSAAGTSTGAPWKRHPYMTGWTGSYTHAAGDSFIFKGGVTWPAAVFPMTISAGGSSNGTRDLYGADASWYSGGSWSRPVWDMEDTWTSTGYSIKVDGVDYITFADLDIKRHRGKWNSEGGYFGNFTLQIYGEADGITVTNCWIRDWSLPMPWTGLGNDDDGNSGGVLVIASGSGGDEMVFINNLFTQENAPGGFRGGVALKGGGLIFSNEFRVLCDALVGGGTVVSNRFTDIQDATDTSLHEDVMYCTANAIVAANYISNCVAAAPVIYLEPNRASTSGETLVYNNVVFNTGYPPISVDLGGGNDGSPLTIKVFNNTVELGGSSCVRVVDRGNPLGELHVTNNVFITSAEPYAIPSGTVEALTSGYNLTNTAAAAATYGATEANGFQFTNAAAPSVDAALNLSGTFTLDILGVTRPSAWDIGAYEFTSGGEPEPPAPNRPVNRIGRMILR